MKRLSLLALAGALCLGGCTTDEIDPPIFGSLPDGGGGDGGGMGGECPRGPAIPDEAGLSLPCCSRASNASRLDDVQLRLSSIRFLSPGSLTATPLINGLLQQAIDEERFNWMLRVTGAEGSVSVAMGAGLREDGPVFRLPSDEAEVDTESPNPLKADASRWNPPSVMATYGTSGEFDTLNFDGPSDFVSIPVFNAAGAILLEFPLSDTTFSDIELYDDRTCAGARNTSVPNIGFSAGGRFETFVTIADVIDFEVNNPPLSGPLCQLLAQTGNFSEECDPDNRTTWVVLPDSTCDDTGCTLGGCDGMTDCNAWQITAEVSLAGVDIQ